MLDLLEIPLTPGRMQCGLLPFKVLKTMVYSLCLTTGAESHEPREEQGTWRVSDQFRGRGDPCL